MFEDFLRHVVGSSLHKPLEAVGTEVADVEFEAELEVFEGQEGLLWQMVMVVNNISCVQVP